MKFPFVSRERLEDVQRQLTESEAERKRLLKLLLEGPDRPEPIKATAPAEKKDSKDTGSNMVPFTTPFDSAERKCTAALRQGKVPQQFRAKAVR